MPDFIQYQVFLTPEAAQPLLTLLRQQEIPFETSFDQHAFDVTFAYNSTRTQFVVKLRQQDFDTARALETAVSEQLTASVAPDHYLFNFSDEELFDLLAKPDEWSNFDVTLAQQLLRKRGRDVSPDAVRLLRQHRAAELARPEESQKAWILAGYAFALLGGLIGLFIGWHLASHKKQLFDGRQVRAFSAADQAHGWRILGLGAVSIIGWTFLRWYTA
ncbi:hypothetical protein J0X19_18895 [Hymenobacter sp. BT186]|uniref:Uncharacterized protein n=1 Tax=Hymenobacter telluris TaxID=2816474 RepID=A0A939F0S3_9BACT|nr:hypothetical protein [Hymenobacter telluris]MBO0360035.1 hypothetical protein [Hymenobacter telluris]MBW3376062.1 hypothetical protein [Hymenobacter norwichensis]